MATKRIYTPEEAEEALKKMPQESRDLLYSQEMRKILMSVGEKHALHLDQLASLEQETVAVMLGFTETADYPEMLSGALNVDTAKATAIAKDMSDTLFNKIREGMKKMSAPEKSVVIPSSINVVPKPPVPQAPTPVAPKLAVLAPTISTAPSAPAMPKLPTPVPDLHPAEVVLTEKTVQVPAPVPKPEQGAKPEPPKPQPYKADPYREPVE